MSRRIILLVILFALWAFVARLVPHAANMTPIGALAIFAGVYFPRRWAYAVPLAILLVSDAWIGGYELPVMLSVYGSFVLVALIGSFLKQESFGTRVFIGAFASSFLFFLITNFAVWAWTPLYTKNLGGLLQSYILALPFWRNMLVGDLFYTAVFFGITSMMTAPRTYSIFHVTCNTQHVTKSPSVPL